MTLVLHPHACVGNPFHLRHAQCDTVMQNVSVTFLISVLNRSTRLKPFCLREVGKRQLAIYQNGFARQTTQKFKEENSVGDDVLPDTDFGVQGNVLSALEILPVMQFQYSMRYRQLFYVDANVTWCSCFYPIGLCEHVKLWFQLIEVLIGLVPVI